MLFASRQLRGFLSLSFVNEFNIPTACVAWCKRRDVEANLEKGLRVELTRTLWKYEIDLLKIAEYHLRNGMPLVLDKYKDYAVGLVFAWVGYFSLATIKSIAITCSKWQTSATLIGKMRSGQFTDMSLLRLPPLYSASCSWRPPSCIYGRCGRQKLGS